MMVLAELEPDHPHAPLDPFFQQVGGQDEWPALERAFMTSNGSSNTSTLRSSSPAHRRPLNLGRSASQAPTLAETLRHTYGTNHGMTTPQPPQQQQPHGGGAGTPKNPKLYKTELCRSWMDSGRCNYGERCQYAHGEAEKRPVPRHPKYKTEACQSYHQTGYCPYGPRCHFIHNEEPHVLAQLVAQNAAAAAATKAQQQQTIQQQHHHHNNNNNGSNGGRNPRPTSLFAQPPQPPQARGRSARHSQDIAAAAAMAAAAFNQQPQLFSRQFQTQLQMFNESAHRDYGKPSGKTTGGFQAEGVGSTGDSPIPSSTDSGTESPLGSFSPGFDADAEGGFGARAKAAGGARAPAPLAWSLAEDFGGLAPFGRAPAAAAPARRPFLGALHLLAAEAEADAAFAKAAPPAHGLWPGAAAAPAPRLPVFERLSNGP